MPHFRLALLVMSLKRTSRPTSFSQFVRFCEGTSTSHRRYNERRQQTQFFLTMLRETQLAPAPLTSTPTPAPRPFLSIPSSPSPPRPAPAQPGRGIEWAGWFTSLSHAPPIPLVGRARKERREWNWS